MFDAYQNTTNIAIIGHFKSGKSSVVGRMLSELRVIDQNNIRRLQKEASNRQKSDKYLAFCTDCLTSERDYGMTMDLANNQFFIGHKNFQIFDTPGHIDFLDKSISGISQADFCIISVDVSIRKNIEDKVINPTKNFAYLSRSCGVSNLIIALNKVDKINSNREKIENMKSLLAPVLAGAGFKPENYKFCEISALNNLNVLSRHNQNQLSLIEMIDEINTLKADKEKPFRLKIEDFYLLKHGSILGNCISGKVLSGILKVDSKIIIPQAEIQGIIKEIEKNGQKVESAVAGDTVDFTLKNDRNNFSKIMPGFLVSYSDYPIPLCNSFRIRGITNSIAKPILKNQDLTLIIGSMRVQVKVKRIQKEIIGKVVKERPRCLRGKTLGEIDFVSKDRIPIEKFKNIQSLGRCIFLDKQQIVLSGLITELLN